VKLLDAMIGGGGAQWEKSKIFVPSPKNILFAILDNSKNILENRFFDLTSS
jgi:hypothetical protein